MSTFRRWRMLLSFTAISLLGLAALPLTMYGQFAVFDGATYTELGTIWKQDISTYTKIVEEYKQIVKIYTQGVQMYELANTMTNAFSHANRVNWGMVAVQGFDNYTQSKYGEAAQWPMMANGQPSLVPQAWARGTTQLNLLSGPGALGELVTHLATVEAMDGSAESCYQTLADYRSKNAQNDTAAASLDQDASDDSPDQNTFMKQLNLVVGVMTQNRIHNRSAGDLQACLVEQQILQNKAQRDSIAGSLNDYDHAAGVMSAPNSGFGDPSETIAGWLPL